MEPPDRCDPRRAHPAWCRQSSLSPGRPIAGRPIGRPGGPGSDSGRGSGAAGSGRGAAGGVAVLRSGVAVLRGGIGSARESLALSGPDPGAGSPGGAADRMGAAVAMAIAGGATLLGVAAQVEHRTAGVGHGADAVGIRAGRCGPAPPAGRNGHGGASSHTGACGMSGSAKTPGVPTPGVFLHDATGQGRLRDARAGLGLIVSPAGLGRGPRLRALAR